MKRVSKIAACLLAFVSLLSVTACSEEKKDKGNYPSIVDTGIGNVAGTVHETYVGTTSYKLVSGGQTEYKILVSEDERVALATAVNELQTLFADATGIQLEVQMDTGDAFDSNAKYISLGETAALISSGIAVDYDTLGKQGYQIETKGQSIFVCGQSRGVLYGVYGLLNKLIGFEAYNDKVYYMEKGKQEIALPDLKIKEVPDIEHRIPVMGAQLNNKTSTNRMYMQPKDEVIIAEGNAHNVLKYIVPLTEESANAHPSWFSGDRTQLCYTAHGDEAEYELMVAEAIENIKEILVENPNQNSLSITQMDVQTWCECSTCQGLEDYYGTNAASQIRFVNDVTDVVNEWLEIEQGGREVDFMIFAYHKSEGAPAVQNEDGTWSPIDETVVLNDNVSVWIALIYENYTENVMGTDGLNTRTIMESWHACAKSYYVWAYNVYFDNYLIPYDSYGALQDLVKYFVQHDTRFLWAQGNWNLHQSTGYDDLKAYLFAKLMWNCNLDMNTLISDYFDKVYREAADIMEGTFWAWRAHSEQQRAIGKSGNIYTSPKEAKFWPKRYLVGQLDAMEEAKKVIEKYKESDPELYQSIYDSIVCETISPRFLMLELYSNTFSKAELAAFKAAFKEDTNRLDFNMISEQEIMDGYTD